MKLSETNLNNFSFYLSKVFDYQGIDFPCQVLEQVETGCKKYCLIQNKPDYERSDFNVTGGEKILIKQNLDPRYKTVDKLKENRRDARAM